MPETRILKFVEKIVLLWVDNTPKWMQFKIGWKIYFKIMDHYC